MVKVGQWRIAPLHVNNKKINVKQLLLDIL